MNLSKEINADRVFIIPAAVSPFKKGSVASDEDRLAMCRLAFSEDLFEVSDWEIKKGGKSYTVDTLKELTCPYIGMDVIKSLLSRTIFETPLPSLPKTIAHPPEKSVS